jgi:hypothetical protein
LASTFIASIGDVDLFTQQGIQDGFACMAKDFLVIQPDFVLRHPPFPVLAA